MTKYKQLY